MRKLFGVAPGNETSKVAPTNLTIVSVKEKGAPKEKDAPLEPCGPEAKQGTSPTHSHSPSSVPSHAGSAAGSVTGSMTSAGWRSSVINARSSLNVSEMQLLETPAERVLRMSSRVLEKMRPNLFDECRMKPELGGGPHSGGEGYLKRHTSN